MAKKELTYEDISKINNIEALKDFQEIYKDNLADIILKSSHLDYRRYNELDEKTKRTLRLIFVKDLLETFDEIFNIKSDKKVPLFPIILEPIFAEVLNVLNKEIIVRELEESVVKRYKINDKRKFKVGQCIFAIKYKDLYDENEYYLYEDFVDITEEEMYRIDDLYAEGIYGNYHIGIFINEIIIRRALQKHNKVINSLVDTYRPELESFYDQETLFNFFNHFNQINKYLYFLDEEKDIYNMDYYDFLVKEAKAKNFTVEGDLEDFIEIVEELMLLAEEDLGKDIESLKSLEKVKENIFIIRKILSDNNSLTPINFIFDIGEMFPKEEKSLLGGISLGLMAESLLEQSFIEVTKTNKQIKAKNRRDLVKNIYPSLDEKGKDFKDLEFTLNLVFSALYGNGHYNHIDPGIVSSKDSLYFVLDNDPNTRMANLIRLIFTPECFSHFFSISKVAGKEMIENFFNNIDQEKSYSFDKTKKAITFQRILNLLYLIKVEKTQDGNIYSLTRLGKSIKKRLLKMQKPAKILKLENYK